MAKHEAEGPLDTIPEQIIVSQEYGTVRLLGFNALTKAEVTATLLPEDLGAPAAA